MLRSFIPNMYVPSIYQIDLEALKQQGITSIIVDLDNTLVESTQPYAPPKLLAWLNRLHQEEFRVMIVSNNSKHRVTRFAQPLAIPYIYTARKPLSFAFRKAMQHLACRRDQIAVVGDQLLTDVLGGNRMGLFTILVVPVSQSEGLLTRTNRWVERLIFHLLKKNNYFHKEDSH